MNKRIAELMKADKGFQEFCRMIEGKPGNSKAYDFLEQQAPELLDWLKSKAQEVRRDKVKGKNAMVGLRPVKGRGLT